MALRKLSDITSSMTSVTEEDVSLSESDTTETSYSQASSLIISSTDPCVNENNYNTDDKLTPSFNSFSISNYSNRKGKLMNEDKIIDSECIKSRPKDSQFSFAWPFSAECSNMQRNTNASHHYKTKRKHLISSYHEQECRPNQQIFQRDRNDNSTQFAIDSPDYNLYTDFCRQPFSPSGRYQMTHEGYDEEISEEISSDESERPYFPDMTSSSWYTAQVFDKYWSYCNFAMDWYREHMNFVKAYELSTFAGTFYTSAKNHSSFGPKKSRVKDKKKKKKQRARRRRAAKAGRKLKLRREEELGLNEDNKEEEEDEETIEMEITEDMMNFFSQSFKHRLERDKLKENNGEEEAQRIDLEQAISGHDGPTTNAPVERPGVRRTAEMKLLYGKGAAMIHGMETALQMTFDKFVDINQPKLWPNMPLKMHFN